MNSKNRKHPETGGDSRMVLRLALFLIFGAGLTGAGIARRCR